MKSSRGDAPKLSARTGLPNIDTRFVGLAHAGPTLIARASGKGGMLHRGPLRIGPVRRIAQIAFEVNERTENIGARRLSTVMERLLEEVSFDATRMEGQTVTIDGPYVDTRLKQLSRDEDLSRYIL